MPCVCFCNKSLWLDSMHKNNLSNHFLHCILTLPSFFSASPSLPAALYLRPKTVLCKLQVDHSPLAIFQRPTLALRVNRSLTSTLHSQYGVTGSLPNNLFVSGIMADNKNSATTTRPRLLSDILENPLSEAAIPDEYNMHRSPISPAPNRHYEGQGGLPQPHLNPYQQPAASQQYALASAPDPGIIGQPLQRTSSGALSSQGIRLQPLTPVNSLMSHRYHENRRSAPNPLPAFTTSPVVSDAGSPSHSQFPSLERSFSQTSLNAPRYPSHPRTPTPSSSGLRAKISNVPRSSSMPSSPKLRRPTPHPHGKPSVKHLTCFWWKVKGECRFSEDDCLYAHRETGLLADAPRQVTPGGEQVHVLSCAYTDSRDFFLRTSQSRPPP